jgi:hypothetical protein
MSSPTVDCQTSGASGDQHKGHDRRGKEVLGEPKLVDDSRRGDSNGRSSDHSPSRSTGSVRGAQYATVETVTEIQEPIPPTHVEIVA